MKQQQKTTRKTNMNNSSVLENGTGELIKQKNKIKPKEYGGRKDGLDPTRYGDWEKNGRCIDF